MKHGGLGGLDFMERLILGRPNSSSRLAMIIWNPDNIWALSPCAVRVSIGYDGKRNAAVFPVSRCGQRIGSRVFTPSADPRTQWRLRAYELGVGVSVYIFSEHNGDPQ